MNKSEVKPFLGKVLIGYVILQFATAQRKASTVDFTKKATSDSAMATIVGVGPEDEFPRDKNVKIGSVALVPRAGKQEFKKDGINYLVIHHRELKVVWPNEDS